jgi:hypothetical protein
MENPQEQYNNNHVNDLHGNLTQIPVHLLRFISTTGECSEQRKERERKEDETNQQSKSNSFYYGVYDTVNHFVNYYYGPSSSRKNQFTQLLNKIFSGILIAQSQPSLESELINQANTNNQTNTNNQVINSRGNGLCAYNCLYMFLTMSRPDILDLYDTNDFAVFKQKIRDMAVYSLDSEIREFMIPLIDDPSTPDLDPIFTSFVNFTGINILMININDNTFMYTKSQFTNNYKAPPSDYLVIIRKAEHLMFLHSNKDFTHRQLLYQQIESNIN